VRNRQGDNLQFCVALLFRAWSPVGVRLPGSGHLERDSTPHQDFPATVSQATGETHWRHRVGGSASIWEDASSIRRCSRGSNRPRRIRRARSRRESPAGRGAFQPPPISSGWPVRSWPTR